MEAQALKRMFGVLLAISLSYALQNRLLAQSMPSTGQDSTHISSIDTLSRAVKVRRNWIVAGSTAASFTGSYVFLRNAWWRDQRVPFHLDGGRDLRYALNLDKVAHFSSGVWIADLYTDAFEWAGYSRKRAAWYGASMAFVVHLSTELKDAYAPRWGFSLVDLASGTLGGLLVVGQTHSPFLSRFGIKATYWQRTPKYFEVATKRTKPFSIDDYLNQTFWLSYYPKTTTEHLRDNRWPDWLGLSLGKGIEPDFWDGNGGGRHEWYLAPDIHLERLLKPKKKFWKKVVKVLNYTRLPLPALQVHPKVKFYGLFL